MVVEFLRAELERRATKNPRYSIRAFARDLETNHATLTGILSEKRPLTFKTAKYLLSRLGLDPEQRSSLLATFTEEDGSPVSNSSFTPLAEDTLALIGGWEHYAILSLLETKNCRHDIKWLAEKLSIDTVEVEAAVARLLRSGLLQKRGTRWVPTHKKLSTTHDIPNSTLQRIHEQHILKAISSLQNDPVDIRDITGITMAIPKSKLPLAKKMITRFRRNLADVLEAGETDEVYRLNIQFFPLSIINKKKR